MSDATAYPLYWPVGKPRAKWRERSRFKTTLGRAIHAVQHEVKLLGGSNFIISSNLHLRLDGLPYASQRQPTDPGVAVYFRYKQKPMCFACDRWRTVEENIWAAAKTIEALRGIERWGTGSMVEQAFTGFAAIEPPSKRPWREVLGFQYTLAPTTRTVESVWRELVKKHHPDRGGDPALMAEINAAMDEARAELK